MATDELLERAERRVGTTLKGKYRIDSVLGTGGMAVVYAATHRNKKRFAIKMLHPELSIQGDAKQRFLREGYVANTVEHAGAVAVLDDDIAEDGAAFIVMELLEGQPVDELWEKRGRQLAPQAVLAIIDQLLAVLHAAHKKEIVHRDLKPANLFLLRDGTVKVLDFGIARLREAVASGPSAVTQSGALLGTPAFLPPEQAGGRTSEVDGQTDLWAVGATMFTLLSGQYVHVAENPTQMVIAAATKPARSLAAVMVAPTPIVALVDRALAFDKAARWPSASALREALRETHRSMFGTLPARDRLEELFVDVGTAPTLAPPAMPVLASSPVVATLRAPGVGVSAPVPGVSAHQVELLGGTTAQPVASSAVPSSVAGVPKRLALRKPLGVFAGAVVAAVALGLFVRPGAKHADGATAPPPQLPSTETATTPASPSTWVAAVASTTTVPIASNSSSPDVKSAKASVTATARSSPPNAAAASAKAAPSSTPTLDCNPPFYFDAQNVRHFKPECVK